MYKKSSTSYTETNICIISTIIAFLLIIKHLYLNIYIYAVVFIPNIYDLYKKIIKSKDWINKFDIE